MKTRIKICGLTREEDVDAAVAAGADAIGFVFYPPSPRYLTPQRAAELARRVPPFVAIVGLFVLTWVIAVNRRISGSAKLAASISATPTRPRASAAATGQKIAYCATADDVGRR